MDSCPLCHEPWTKKISNSDKNPNRVYNTCQNCFVEKPGEWWCWDGTEPNQLKIQTVKKALLDKKRLEHPVPDSEFKIKKRKREEGGKGAPNPFQSARKRNYDIDSDDSVSPQLPRTSTDITLERQELQLEEYNRNLSECREILSRIEEILKKEYQ